MKTRSFCLTEAQAHELQAAFLHCQDALTKIRYLAVRLYGTKTNGTYYSPAFIQDICGCSLRTLLNWTHAYHKHGLTALVDRRLGGNRARLQPQQIEALQNQLHRYTPAALLGPDHCVGDGQFWTIPAVARLLEREYGVVYQSRTSYQTLLQKCGLSYQRPAKQYKSHSEVKLMDFEERLEKKTDGSGSGRTRHRSSSSR